MAVSIFPVPRPPLPFSRRYNFPSFVKGPPAPDLSNVEARPCPCLWALSLAKAGQHALSRWPACYVVETTLCCRKLPSFCSGQTLSSQDDRETTVYTAFPGSTTANLLFDSHDGAASHHPQGAASHHPHWAPLSA